MARKVEAKFARVVPQFWTDEKVHPWPDAQKTLAVYLLTCEHRNLQGFYRLPLNYAADDLGWSVTKVRKYLAKLEAEQFCEYDDTAKVMLVTNTLRFYRPSNDDQVTAALRSLAKVPATPLKQRFAALAKSHGATKLADRLLSGEGVPS